MFHFLQQVLLFIRTEAMRFVFPLLIFCFFSPAYGKNVMIYFGEGGESTENDSTIFDNAITQALVFAKKSNWESEFYSTHKHSKTMNIFKSQNVETKEFSAENIQKRFEKLKSEIENGNLKSGDQVLINLNTHGIVEGEDYSIATADQKSFLPEIYLRQIINLAEQRGVKIAINGLTCYSGQLQSLATDKTCVISTSQSDQLGYMNDSNLLIFELGSSGNLENAYISGRNRVIFPFAQPQISTPAGKKTAMAINSLKSYLTDFNKDKSTFLNDNPICTYAPSHIAELKKSLPQIQQSFFERFFYGHRESGVEPQLLIDLEKALQELDKARTSTALTKYVETADLPEPVCAPDPMDLKNEICIKKPNLLFHYYKLATLTKKNSRAPNPKTLARINQAIETFKEASDKFDSTVSKLDDQHSQFKVAAQKVHQLERKLYDQLYEAFSKESKNQPNPCRDFKL